MKQASLDLRKVDYFNVFFVGSHMAGFSKPEITENFDFSVCNFSVSLPVHIVCPSVLSLNNKTSLKEALYSDP